jgi:hypothetical protein
MMTCAEFGGRSDERAESTEQDSFNAAILWILNEHMEPAQHV